MFYCPPRAQLYTEKGEPYFTWLGKPENHRTGVGRGQILLAKLGPLLLTIAFFLQIVAAFSHQ